MLCLLCIGGEVVGWYTSTRSTAQLRKMRAVYDLANISLKYVTEDVEATATSCGFLGFQLSLFPPSLQNPGSPFLAPVLTGKVNQGRYVEDVINSKINY